MIPEVQVLAQVLTIVAVFTTFVVAGGLVVRAIVMKKPKPAGDDSGTPRVDDSRFARLEQAVDSIAIEVERIAEAQRFSAKLMSERLPNRLPDSVSERLPR